MSGSTALAAAMLGINRTAKCLVPVPLRWWVRMRSIVMMVSLWMSVLVAASFCARVKKGEPRKHAQQRDEEATTGQPTLPGTSAAS